jgi:MFS transporter, ACS family, hexuronate transporter
VHRGWPANLFTLACDMFRKRAAGSMVGLGGFGGGFGGMLIATVTGLRQFTEGYVSSLVTGAFRYLAALLLIQLLVG